MCRFGASAIVDGNSVEILVSCVEHGVQYMDAIHEIGEDLNEFLAEGASLVARGQLPRQFFDAAIVALKDAGVSIPAKYLGN